MKALVIEVTQVEEWQMLGNLHELEALFAKAQSTIVNGESVILARRGTSGPPQQFDALTTLEDLEQYRQQVFKYL